MRRRIALFVALCVSSAAVSGSGQDQLPATLFSKCGAIRVEFVLGRLTVLPEHRGQVRLSTPQDSDQERTESLFVNNDDSSPVLRYQYEDAQQTIELEVINYREVNLAAHQKETARTVEFRQPLRGDIEVVTDNEHQRREVKARSFWHLMLAERVLCETQLVPILELLRPDWHLNESTERLEAGLFHGALSQTHISRRYMTQLVAQLDSNQFQKRQIADSQLRACGPAALPFLDSLPRHTLSGEQRVRIDRIRRSIASPSIDSPERTAEWLGDDEQVWFALLKHRDPQRRHLAAIRLTAIRSQSLEFDPYGEESYRQQQLAQLESQIIRQ